MQFFLEKSARGCAGSCEGLAYESVPAQHDLAGLARFHQLEAFLELLDRQLVRERLAEREAAEHELRHLVPGLVHLPAVDAMDGEALEDDLVPVGACALGHDA